MQSAEKLTHEAVATTTEAAQTGPIEYVPLKRLVVSPHNVRKSALRDIPGLAESIAAEGVSQNLIVHGIVGKKGKNAPLGVCAGQRRLAALTLLLEQGRVPDTYLVPVLVVPEREALLRSLTENEHHDEMHPADKAIAFSALLLEGREPAFVASVFGLSEAAVRRHIKLACLSPKLMDLFRTDELSWDQATTLVLTDDHEKQERVWFAAAESQQSWLREPYHLREAIVGEETDIRTSDALRFVTANAYEAAGGYIRRDLFSGANAGYIADHELLNRLVAEKLELHAQSVRAEGWSWVELHAQAGNSGISYCVREKGNARALRDEELSVRASLEVAVATAQGAWDAYCESDGEADFDVEHQLRDAIRASAVALADFDRATLEWSDEQRAASGAFVMVGSGGALRIERGLRRREYEAGERAVVPDPTASAPQSVKVKPEHSESLCRRLTAHRTAAVRAELAGSARMAMAVLLHRMIPVVLEERFHDLRWASALELDLRRNDDGLIREADDLAETGVWQEIESERAKWLNLLPLNPDHLLGWLIDADQSMIDGIFAYCVAATLDSVTGKDEPHHINRVADALELDMRKHWAVSGKGYLTHVSKDRICLAVADAVGPEAGASLAGMKKADAVRAAELRLEGTGWLPSVLRNREVPEVRHYGFRDADDEGGADDDMDGQQEAASDECDTAIVDGVAGEHDADRIAGAAADETHADVPEALAA
ncbi:Putative plasmid stabilization protein [Paraburkholderia tropica]|uniref:ParB/RepB/Spo0J family partition protein n=1 Tax=Paraburkholderia tropica TaxID=92647 RepID=UPI001CAC6DF4|nr:ParB/RepB/Spo0J family partition protein [Paraburkholderia tropica]CAG9235842.1 Putative plasmid stabilization protein [Paraburkholderia tropica]